MHNVIDTFRFEHGFLSNFFPATIEWEGIWYKSVEHAYQASKTLDPDTRKMIASAPKPGVAKALGKCVELRNDWDSVKIDIMRKLIRLKFDSAVLAAMLVQTGDAELIEGNTWNDTFWGVCRGQGANFLGQILMDEREFRKKQALEDEALMNKQQV